MVVVVLLQFFCLGFPPTGSKRMGDQDLFSTDDWRYFFEMCFVIIVDDASSHLFPTVDFVSIAIDRRTNNGPFLKREKERKIRLLLSLKKQNKHPANTDIRYFSSFKNQRAETTTS
jgi:hypothetical protein